MAKFEEADPRWLVKDMGEAGRNVNNWHWTERDCTEWVSEMWPYPQPHGPSPAPLPHTLPVASQAASHSPGRVLAAVS